MSRPPLVIVNADDWGQKRESTDLTLACFEAGRLTSSTAMVYMEDTKRAASLAATYAVPLGLHLNLTESYTAPLVPADARRRQASLASYFGSHSAARWLYNPVIRKAVREVIGDQLIAFQDQYGRLPIHVDSHHHIHTSPNVLLDGGLPAGIRVRPTFTFLSGQKSNLNRFVRAATNAYLMRRFVATDYFFHLSAFEDIESLPDNAPLTVELMTHPAWVHEYELLMSDDWHRATDNWRLGTYADLHGVEQHTKGVSSELRLRPVWRSSEALG
jgi:predicted glycoside hydrolase/deacetylase ChbG (UPF0249 family)